ncbi:8863_t:CDS:2 [Scutellospora calospora]|uniref:8863_t:CDS:1 n=1 Tax=Scutellospora calospora TaxID=85575 RepID=A0ACA9LWG2_9GLOM|nr:8863_t:CDS:2 [Scutellospora calospora]
MILAQKYFKNITRGSNLLFKRLASTQATTPSYKVVVIGGGTGGLAVSSTISQVLGKSSVAIIEPSSYQPLWTFVGAGLKNFEESAKLTEELIPENADWIKNKAAKVDPENNTVVLQDGQQVKYDYLVVATGIQVNWDKIKGLPESIGKPNSNVTSIYSDNTVKSTWDLIKNFSGGNAIFTMPTYLAEDRFTKNFVRNRTKVIYNTAMAKIFSVEKYANSLNRIAKERDIQVNLKTELTEIHSEKNEAVFKDLNTGESKVYNYNLLHVVPPMGPPSFIAESKIGNAAGWVDVDQYTLQHVKYPNIFSLGDSSSAPTSKTAAAISSQSGVLKKNLLDVINGTFNPSLAAKYDGYASCPLLVGKDKLVLAEFSGYTLEPMETFPFDQSVERKSMYYLTKEIIPEIYWSRLLKGTWTGPHGVRQLLSYMP